MDYCREKKFTPIYFDNFFYTSPLTLEHWNRYRSISEYMSTTK